MTSGLSTLTSALSSARIPIRRCSTSACIRSNSRFLRRTSGGVSEPEYLANLDKFAEYLRTQPEVTHVYTLSDIMKRLNRNMHADDDAFYRTPADRELSAQYLLLYELSLPYGLDLNDRINIDKSASRVTATLGRTSTEETRLLLQRVDDWMASQLADLHAR